ncbi:MAG: hypothetical protein LUC16_00235 [Coprobacillus sp.]|nr:hypothetical protein [Coprobacillus sp.]
MKYILNALVIVEGENDKSYLKSFLDCDIFVTHGTDINEEDFLYLTEVSKVRKIILLLDPDDVGRSLSNQIQKKVPNCEDVLLYYPSDNKKHGVFECPKDIVIKTLEPYFDNNRERPSLTIEELRPYLTHKKEILSDYHIRVKNNRNILNKLCILKISEKDLKLKYGNQ